MCLKKVDLALGFENDEIVGYGYKTVLVHDSPYVKRSEDRKLTGTDYLTYNDISFDKWVKSNAMYLGTTFGYKLGFHIFLNKLAAEDYIAHPSKRIYLVKFKEVLAFGSNTTLNSYGPCVVANQIQFVRDVTNEYEPINRNPKNIH
jgi:hypothetical protein